MCGIIGYVGSENCLKKILNGLKDLEYRGYDSAGIAYVKNNNVVIKKTKGKIKRLAKKVRIKTQTNLGIGHTRWATHGASSTINAHPHRVGKFTVVHNGIIENYQELKEMLIKENYKFKSTTDSEIACALLDYIYKEEKDILKTINKVNQLLVGTFAFGIICSDDVNTIYTTRKTSPLVIATSKEGNFIASDIPAILKYTNKYILLDDTEIGVITNNKVKVYDNDLKLVKKSVNTYELTKNDVDKSPYKDYMLKEIHEEDKVVNKTIEAYFDGTKKSLEKSFGFLKNFNKFDIVACGSAYYAGVIAKYLLENYANIPVNVEIASEYRYKKCFYDANTLVIVVSQSGETADTLETLKKAQANGAKTLAIVNVYLSSIARIADYVIYTKAGSEIAVATTKAYVCQLIIFSLITMYLGNIKIPDIKKLPNIINEVINDQTYLALTKKIAKCHEVFFIGRGVDYATTLEASLKLKEITYINSNAYPAGELKHGTISLIKKGTMVIAIATEKELTLKMISNIKEVKARGAYVILLTNEVPKEKFYDELIIVPKVHFLIQPIINVIPFQLLAYHVAKIKGYDVDKPRNLAKSVTVE